MLIGLSSITNCLKLVPAGDLLQKWERGGKGGLCCIYFQIILQKWHFTIDTCGRLIYWNIDFPFVLFSCPFPRMLFCFISSSFCLARPNRSTTALCFKAWTHWRAYAKWSQKAGKRQEPRRESRLRRLKETFLWGGRVLWSGKPESSPSVLFPCNLLGLWPVLSVEWPCGPVDIWTFLPGILALIKSSSSSWKASFKKQQRHLPARDPVVLDRGPISSDQSRPKIRGLPLSILDCVKP